MFFNLFQTGSKYFKPGFIFSKDKDVAKASETSLKEDDFINDDELNEVISQACSQLKQPNLTGSQPSTSSSLDTTIDRINQIESQQVDFTSKSISSIPSLKGGNTILGMLTFMRKICLTIFFFSEPKSKAESFAAES